MKNIHRLPIEEDPAIKNLLARMPENIKSSFSEDQLYHLRNAVASRQWGNHSIDYRTTFKLFTRRYYLVLLLGHNVREISREKIKRQLIFNSILLSVFMSLCMLFGLIALYVIKSAFGIDLFPNFSIGLWSWIKS